MLDTIKNKTNLEKQNKGSLFLLPFIFAIMMIVVSYMLAFINAYFYKIQVDMLFIFNVQFTVRFMSNFSIGFIILFIHKVYKCTPSNLLLLFIFSVLICLSQFLFSRYILGSPQIKDFFYNLLGNYAAVYSIFTLILTLLSAIFVAFIIPLAISYLIFYKGHHNRESYQLLMETHHILFAFIFSIIFNTLFVAIINPGLYAYLILELKFYDVSMRALIASTFIICINLLNFLFVFLSVKSCFKREFNYVPLKLIFKSVGWSYLYLIILNIVTCCFYYFILLSKLKYYRKLTHLLMDYRPLIIIISIIVLIIQILLLRKAVKKYFAQCKEITDDLKV